MGLGYHGGVVPRPSPTLLLLLLAACLPTKQPVDTAGSGQDCRWFRDSDGDGFGNGEVQASSSCDEGPAGYAAEPGDCDDDDPAVNPGAAEICDGVDNDCDGFLDDGDPDLVASSMIPWFLDEDGDGYGRDSDAILACSGPTGFVDQGGDCDDYDDSVNPAADEVCDGLDNDCDGTTDEADALDAGSWYADGDGDAYGDGSVEVQACEAPSGFVAVATDCDDTDSAVNPGAQELCNGVDDDCDEVVDPDDSADALSWYPDDDADGYGDGARGLAACEAPVGYGEDGTDCDDSEPAVNPGASEVCDALDNDCDGLVDLEDPGLDTSTTSSWYADADGDGFGDPALSTVACEAPTGFVADSTDCDDTAATVYPGTSEICDGVDNDCDGLADDADSGLDTSTASSWYSDADSDGYGDPGSSSLACGAPDGTVADSADCDDTDASVNPAASEICDEKDDDCDGLTDDADPSLDTSTGDAWYVDDDGDGYGDSSSGTLACEAPSGTVADSSDCDDSDAAVSPAASEVCDGIDNDCDGQTADSDPGLDTSTTSTWYQDDDGDGYGQAGSVACTQPTGTVATGGDCDDGDAAVNPAASEVCNGIDDDCDSLVDSADGSFDTSSYLSFYLDDDGDGYGQASSTIAGCTLPSGYAEVGGDCDDADSAVNPAASEICDELDNDCDGDVDDDDADLDETTADTWYADDDLDGYGQTLDATAACQEPSGYTDAGGDCDDLDADINPGASEACDGVDEDCDGDVDDGSSCPCDVQTYDGHGYMFCYGFGRTWISASNVMSSYGYLLATVNDADENSWLASTASGYSSSSGFWIGFNDRSSEGSFVWDSGESPGYTSWDSGQPDDYLYLEDCAHMGAGGTGLWNDASCWSFLNSIYEAH